MVLPGFLGIGVTNCLANRLARSQKARSWARLICLNSPDLLRDPEVVMVYLALHYISMPFHYMLFSFFMRKSFNTQRLLIALGPSNNVALRPPRTSGCLMGSGLPRSLWVLHFMLAFPTLLGFVHFMWRFGQGVGPTLRCGALNRMACICSCVFLSLLYIYI